MSRRDPSTNIDKNEYRKIIYDQPTNSYSFGDSDKLFEMQSGQILNDAYDFQTIFREGQIINHATKDLEEDDYLEWLQKNIYDGRRHAMFRGELTESMARYFAQMVKKQELEVENLQRMLDQLQMHSVARAVVANRLELEAELLEDYRRQQLEWKKRCGEIDAEQLDWESKQRVWETLKK